LKTRAGILENQTNRLLAKTSATAAAIGAALSFSPVPLTDEFVLAGLYVELARRVGRQHGLSLLRVPWRPIGFTIGKGLLARGIVNLGLSFIPGVDTVVNAATAAGLTEVLGLHMDESCANPHEARELTLRQLVDALSKQRSRAERRRTRGRFEVPGLLGNAARARHVEQRIQALPGVTRVRANVRSGRVLITTNLTVAEIRPDLERALRELSDPSAPPPPTLGRLATEVAVRAKRWTKDIASHVRRAADGTMEPAGDHRLERPWHAIAADVVVSELDTNAKNGLTVKAAAERLRLYGANLLPAMQRRTGLEILAGEVFTVPTAMLGTAILLSIASGDVLEGAAIALVLGTNIAVGYFTESSSEELLGAWGRLRAEYAVVVREGREISIKAADLVAGDILVLRAGQAVAADARVLVARDLLLDESTLTGESEPVEKGPGPVATEAAVADRSSIVHTGTVVASGGGRAIVCATGYGTQLGALQRALSRTEQRAAPLERQLTELGRTLSFVALGSSIVVTGLGALRGLPIRTLVRNAIALGVAAIPEGFPAVGTTALALASHRLQKKGIIIRRLAAAETLGAVSVICADKTGTLTENRMRVAEALLPNLELAIMEWQDSRFSMRMAQGSEPSEEAVHNLARIAALNADVEINATGEVVHASGTERALVEFAMAAGYPVRTRRKAAKRIGERRRSPDMPMMSTTHDHPELGRIELAKGAPEEVVPRCRGLSAQRIDEIMEGNARMAGRGLRVLGFAWRRDSEQSLEFAGLLGLRDPPRPHVRQAIEALAQAHIETLMLTGDQQRTASAIGKALGIPEQAVFSRVTPEAKLGIIEKLRDGGAIVGMTGDGVNDGPALKAADVGIAMGERGTDLARAVADVVLAHDDLPSIVEAVAEGRTLYDNVRRAIDYLVATNLSELALMLLGSIVGVTPLSPLHLLWINILTDIAPALALAVEPPERNVMQRPPREPQKPLFGPKDSRRLGMRSMQMTAAAAIAYGAAYVRPNQAPGQRATTMAFASLVTSQLLETNNYRAAASAKDSQLRWVLGTSLLAQAVAVLSPSVRSILGNAPLDPLDLAVSVATGAAAARWRGREFRWWSTDEITIERANAAAGGEPA
jgi:Ca2+-transporting ATPase